MIARFVRCAAALALLVAAGEAQTARAGTTCVPARIATTAYPVFIVRARVNGRGPFRFFVDTGATVSIISASLAKDLRLEQSPLPVRGVGAGGRFSAHATYATIDVGGAKQEHVMLATFDFSEIAKAVGPTDGGLGYNFLKAYRVTIDYPGSELCLER